MFFSDEGARQLEAEARSLFEKGDRLIASYIDRRYQNPSAQEFAAHGLCRRISTINRCIERVFDIFPPNRSVSIDPCDTADVAIHIQAFLVNIYGAVDNLAWIWVEEKDIMKGGKRPRRVEVGLRKSHEFVRNTFSPQFQSYLASRDEWFAYLEGFRDSVAHRIPLYIPPYSVPEGRLAEFEEYGRQIASAAKSGDVGSYTKLSNERDALGQTLPIIAHSFTEMEHPVVFHPQMITDFNTLEELSLNMLTELNG